MLASMTAVQLFVSPHLDDAVLSCGGVIASIVRQGGEAVVLTVFAGANGGRKLAPYAARYHAKCGLSDFWTRRWEDIEACELLGAGFVHLRFPEILYRYDRHGRPRAEGRGDLFSALRADDEAIVAAVGVELRRWIERLRPAVVCGPAGFGEHVDHLIVNIALRRAVSDIGSEAPRCWLYEDMPYAATGDRTAAIQAALAKAAEPVVRQLAEPDWSRKLRAIEAYRSQLASIWHVDDWRAALRVHAEEVAAGRGIAERVWELR